MKLICVVLIVFLFFINAVSMVEAGPEPTGTRLLRECSYAISNMNNLNYSELMDVAHCTGLIYGIISMNSAYRYNITKDNSFFCPPNIGTEQAVRVVVKYLKEHPESLHENDAVLAIRALVNAFPCKR